MTENGNPFCLRLSQVAKVLGLSQRTVWAMAKDGRIPCLRVGDGKKKVLLFPLDLLKEWVRNEALQCTSAQAAQAAQARGGGR